MKEKKVQTWKEFEMQLTKVVEYKVASMYYAVSKFLYKIFQQKQHLLRQQFERELEEEIEKEEMAKLEASKEEK